MQSALSRVLFDYFANCFAFLNSPFKSFPVKDRRRQTHLSIDGHRSTVRFCCFASGEKTMINKPKLTLIAAGAAADGVSPTSAEYIRNYGSSLFMMARRFYDGRMEKTQMRFAPTKGVCMAGRRSCVSRD
jgi:hypothetical protein